MFGVWTIHRRKELLLKQAHNERMSALEKGVPLPEFPAALLGEADAPSAARSVRSGIGLTLVGIVLYFAFERLEDDLALFGLVPAAVGVANLLYAAVLWRRKQAAAPNP
jgi:hypothetical protein